MSGSKTRERRRGRRRAYRPHRVTVDLTDRGRSTQTFASELDARLARWRFRKLPGVVRIDLEPEG